MSTVIKKNVAQQLSHEIIGWQSDVPLIASGWMHLFLSHRFD